MLSTKETSYGAKVKIKARSLTTFFRRASFLFSFPFKYRASLSVEASLVLPLFLFYIMTLLYGLEIVRFQSDVWEALHQEAVRTGFASYAASYGNAEVIDDEEIKKNIKDYLGRQFLPYLCVEGNAAGLEIHIERNFAGKDNRRLSVMYAIEPFIRILPIGEITVTDHVFVHDWTGYQNDGVWSGEENNGVYVYITPTGKKYHFSEDCTYLKVKLQAVKSESVSEFRNADGEIYDSCEVCGKEQQETVYLTKWGNRYHSTPDCEAIKRTISVVPLSQAGNRTACSKCR